MCVHLSVFRFGTTLESSYMYVVIGMQFTNILEPDKQFNERPTMPVRPTRLMLVL